MRMAAEEEANQAKQMQAFEENAKQQAMEKA